MEHPTRFLQLHADDWHHCFIESLRFLRASWSHDWVGLPAVVQASCDFLDLHEAASSQSVNRMLTAAMAIAAETELRCESVNQFDEPKFHNRLHTADVITVMALQLAIETKLSGMREADWMAAGLLAAVAHDFMHSGGVNISPSQIEKLTCVFLRPLFNKHQVPPEWVARIDSAIVHSDLALMPSNHAAVRDQAFEWNQAWLNLLLSEADVLPSTCADFGPSLIEALSREWMLTGYVRYKTMASESGRQAYLDELMFSSRSALLLRAWLESRLH